MGCVVLVENSLPHYLITAYFLHYTPHPTSCLTNTQPTAAAAYIDDPSAVLELLVSLNKYSDKEKRYFSAMDLPSQAAAGGAFGGIGGGGGQGE